MKNNQLVWKGRVLSSLTNRIIAFNNLTKEEAPEFKKAAEGIGQEYFNKMVYSIVYLDSDVKKMKLYEWLGVEKPALERMKGTPNKAYEYSLRIGVCERRERARSKAETSGKGH
jgi:hypothetical protein